MRLGKQAESVMILISPLCGCSIKRLELFDTVVFLQMPRIFGIEFAPLFTPFKRRLTTVGVLYHFFIMNIFTILGPAMPFILVC